MGLLIHVYMFTFINFKQNVKINCQWKKKSLNNELFSFLKFCQDLFFLPWLLQSYLHLLSIFPAVRGAFDTGSDVTSGWYDEKKGSQIKGGHRQPRHVNLAGNSGLSFPLTRYIPRKYWRDSPENMQTRVRLSCIFILRSSTLQIKGFY